MDFDKLYKSGDIQKIAGVSKIKIIHWCNKAVIRPYEDNTGRGQSRLFNWQNLIEVFICRELNRFNIETKLMKWLLQILRGDRPSPIPPLWPKFKENPTIINEYHLLITGAPIGTVFNKNTKNPYYGLDLQPIYITMQREEIVENLSNYPGALYINIPLLIAEAEKKG